VSAGQLLKDQYPLTFHYFDGTTKPVTVSSDLVLDQNTRSPVFARPSAAPNYEIWHAIYEKAYGIFMLLPPSAKPFHGKDAYKNLPRPDIPSFAGGNALESLEHLTGLSWTQGKTYFNTRNIPGKSFARISDAINAPDQINGITKYPMVAWSFLNAAEANTGYPPNDQIKYDNEIIVGNHAYSILGTVKNNNKNYIVLRNPYGRLWGADPTDPAISPYLYTGAWSPPGFTKMLSVDDGIFALETGRFERYFTAFGWVQ
jgi:hypothetical protein